MRLHTDTLTASDIYSAASAQGMRGVTVEMTSHGSRIRARAFNVNLSGTSSRRRNPGTGSNVDARDEHAATWDEWGMFLGALFVRDPRMIVGTPGRPIYAGALHYALSTAHRFIAPRRWPAGDDPSAVEWVQVLTAAYQHGRAGHRWDYISQDEGQGCTSCDARRVRVNAAVHLDALNRTAS